MPRRLQGQLPRSDKDKSFLIFLLFPMHNFFLTIIFWIDRFLQLLGLRRQRQLGVIYDSVTKQPVDPVVVKLIDVRTTKVVASNIANIQGEYGFMADPGVYQIYVQRPHYAFPSTRIKSLRDGVYYPVYHGENFEFVGGKDVISMSIPLDPIAADWNQEAKKATMPVHPVLQYAISVILRILFWSALLLTVITFLATRADLWVYVLGAYVLVILLALITPRVRLWGRVHFRKGDLPVVGATIEVSHAKLPGVIIAKAVTVTDGKFFIRLGRGSYTVSIKLPQHKDEQSIPPRQFSIKIGSTGVLNREFYL